MKRIVRRVCQAIGVLVVSVVLLNLEGAAVSAERKPPRRTLTQAVQLQKQHSPRLLSVQGVVGTATGVDRTGQFAIKVYARKASVSNLPTVIDGMPVIVEAIGEFRALQTPRRGQPGRFTGPPPQRRHGREEDGGHGRGGDGRRDGGRDFPPTVAIVSPADEEVVSEEVLVTVIAEDDDQVFSVEFFVDDVLLGSDSNGADGWSCLWDSTSVDDGIYTLSVQATDSVGQTTSDQVDVFVDNEAGPFSPDGRPAPIGVSTGNGSECSSGTIACRVRDAQGNVYALSNNHVYARLNDAKMGESILQPGLYDTDGQVIYSDQVIGILTDFVPLDFSRTGNNRIDAAIGLVTAGNLGVATPADGYGTPKSTPVAACVEQPVQKYGRTTFLTTGYVSGIEATVVVSYGTRSAQFTNQIIVSGTQFIDSGDSGSLLVTYDPDVDGDGGREPVGLLFAGTENGSTAIACPIQNVLDAFEVTIDGE